MAKTQEELDQLKQECITISSKLKELTEDELKQVAGGSMIVDFNDTCHFDPPVFSGICVDCPHYMEGSIRGFCKYNPN